MAGKGEPPQIKESERGEVERRSTIRAVVVHEAVLLEGEEELKRSSSSLAWSGLAAGLSMGFSLVAEGLIRSGMPDVSWRPLVGRLGYSVGFLFVVLGRQQLFTENTLTAILPLLRRREGRVLVNVLRLWGIVLLTNLLGAGIFAHVVGMTDVFTPEVRQVFFDLGTEAMDAGFGTLLLRGIFGGWLIALMVWLLPASEGARVPVIVIVTYFVGLGRFSHVIAGSVETLFVVAAGEVSWARYLGGFLAPALIGNILGGVALVAALNHAQVVAGEDREL